MNKKCSKCHEIKSVIEFHKNKARKDGLEAYCKICACEQKRKRRENGGNFTKKQKEATFKKYGRFCQTCGNNDEDKLQIDHLLPQIVCNPNTASVEANAWVLCVVCNRKKDKRIIFELIGKVPRHILGPMLLKKHANVIVQGRFEKVPITIGNKQFTEVKFKYD
ncbi:HNH endonuclease [Bacillus tropicus]|uniref:HNH endonuclease n=1 Tax=Bacillus tropicus TaxID=2026188 RepID=UPI001CFDEC57|nr:HNH endonuclease [Bacillus tropicus]